MEVAGWISLLAVGVSLGALGGGGSMLTVPILVYLFRLPPTTAIGYSLFLVGTTSAFGAAGYAKQRLIDWRAALWFGSASVLAAFLTRGFLVPRLPDEMLGFEKGLLLLLLFAVLMLVVAYRMLFGKAQSLPPHPAEPSKLILVGLAVGFLAGLLGAGGGFLIVPALLFYGALDMRRSIATSLFIIAAQSLIAFIPDAVRGIAEPDLLWMAAAVTVLGVAAGLWISGKSRPESLRPAFGWLTAGVAVFILFKELVLARILFPGIGLS